VVMIISHKHKFIFFKTRKTAGSSIQASLSKICGKDDIITGTNYVGDILDESHSAGLNMNQFWTNHPHPTLQQTRQFLGEKIWNSYFKFAFVRNPWDIAVSRYFWEKRGKRQTVEVTSIDDFRRWVITDLKNFDIQYNYIGSENQIALDFIGRYETLIDDYEAICDKIGIPFEPLPTLKSGFRDKRRYSKFYDDASRERVRRFFVQDINLLDYEFNQKFLAKRVGPVILPDQLRDGGNINGPSLIKVPDWVRDPLGRYYLYFAHHQGKYIRLAYSDNIEGPFRVYEPGTLKLGDTPCYDHIASPDVHIDEDTKRIIMYYHGDTKSGQKTFMSYSDNAIDFKSCTKECAPFYLRVFKYNANLYGIAKNKNIDSMILTAKSWEDNFEPIFNFLEQSRHTSVLVDGNILYLFYTSIGDAPEQIKMLTVRLSDNIDEWKITHIEPVLKPRRKYEGANAKLQPSLPGSSTLGYNNTPVQEIRDPFIYREENIYYLFYSLAGELGIGLAKLYKIGE